MKQKTREGNMFKKISTGFGILAIIFGIMMMAGSAGDCDGKCGPGNDVMTMLLLAGTGLVIFVSGIFFTMVGQSE
jgi:vacuolar-type H+-ATPase subunit I/STV1